MKKILIAALVALNFTACTPEPTPISISVDKATFTQTNSNSSTETLTSVIKNTTSTDGSISWDFSETTPVTGWTYSISINNVTKTTTSGSFDLAGNATATIVVTINPNNVTGTGKATLILKSNDVELSTITYNHTTNNSAPVEKFSISKTSASGGQSITNPMDPEYKTLLKNLTNAPLEIKWLRVAGSQNPSAWSDATCDNITCHAPFVTTSTCTIPANDSFYIKTLFYVANTIGSGSVTTHLFLPSDSLASLKTFVADHQAF